MHIEKNKSTCLILNLKLRNTHYQLNAPKMKILIILLSTSIISASCTTKNNDKNVVEYPIHTDSIYQSPIDSLGKDNYSGTRYPLKVVKSFIKDFSGTKFKLILYASFSTEVNGNLDSILIVIDNKEHPIIIEKVDYEMYQKEQILEIESGISLKDYNFDGAPDISIYNTQSGMKNIIETIYLFDFEKQRFSKNEILSQSSNCSIDSINKTISTFAQGGMSSMIFNSELYNWENNKLRIIKSVRQDYIDEIDRFVRITKTMRNQEWIMQVDTLSEAQLLEMREAHN
ncbi:hypothetical protein SanaruYs_35600 [Chryseotalea sanaruensis]|uniref:Uncharacterized protein n=1 Tax=Chryseotalea sanaruensis TaxID=2482724 RepID=A0A401UEM8_9BACT|nr:hypothetical protein [Chryseotalea sanaruensis]GCC53317.1 hypothetical protein SanaruYs_35600 [Chryseotalea sanaruensis]